MKDVTIPERPQVVASIATNADAFEIFYREHLDTVRRFVARRVADPHLAADLTAEIFLAAVDSASSYRADRGVPAAWLIGVGRHVVAAEFRRQARDRAVVRRISGRRLLDPDSQNRIEERIDAEREARKLYHALACLPDRDRALMELVALDGLSIIEAAVVLGVKPGTARVRLHRSRARVQAQLRPIVQEVIS
jgi:RNA polymerase sigma-70 factor (ECF subfamily)